MAADLAAYAALAITKFAGPFLEALKREQFVFTRLEDAGKIKEVDAKTLEFPVQIGANTQAAMFAENDESVTYGNQTQAKLTIPWAYARVPITISGPALAVGAIGGFAVDPFLNELTSGLRDLRKLLNTQCMTGTGTAPQMNGIEKIIMATGAYAGVADRAASAWAGAYVAPIGTALDEAVMRTAKMALEDDRGATITEIWTSSKQWYKLGDLIKTGVRQEPQVLRGGFLALDWEGIKVIKVPGYTNSRMDFIDMNCLEYKMLPPASGNPNGDGLRNVIAVAGQPAFAILPIGATGDSVKFWLIHYGALCGTNPYRLGCLTGLT